MKWEVWNSLGTRVVQQSGKYAIPFSPELCETAGKHEIIFTQVHNKLNAKNSPDTRVAHQIKSLIQSL